MNLSGYFGIWRLYTKYLTAEVFGKNPFEEPYQTNEKNVFKDLPFLIKDDKLVDYLSKFPHIQIKSNVVYGKVLDENKAVTQYENGDRYIYVKGDVVPPLPSEIELDGHICRVSHKSQSYKCQRCSQSSHKFEDYDKYPGYVDKQNLIAFRYDDDVLSNMYLCDIMYDNTSFSSVEHAYQYAKCSFFNKRDIAQNILLAPTAREAKLLAEHIIKNDAELEHWKVSNIYIMEEILQCKAKSCILFKDTLVGSDDNILAEATSDVFWEAGLTPSQIEHIHSKFFKGRNVLGNLMMSLRSKLRNELTPANAKGAPSSSLVPLPSSEHSTTVHNIHLHYYLTHLNRLLKFRYLVIHLLRYPLFLLIYMPPFKLMKIKKRKHLLPRIHKKTYRFKSHKIKNHGECWSN